MMVVDVVIRAGACDVASTPEDRSCASRLLLLLARDRERCWGHRASARMCKRRKIIQTVLLWRGVELLGVGARSAHATGRATRSVDDHLVHDLAQCHDLLHVHVEFVRWYVAQATAELCKRTTKHGCFICESLFYCLHTHIQTY